MKLALLLALAAAAAQAGTYTCSLSVGGVAVTPIITSNSCSATSGSIGAFAGPGIVSTTGSSFSQNLFGTASMVESILITGLTGTGTLAYHIDSTCQFSAGTCIGALAGWGFKEFQYGQPIPMSLTLWNSDNVNHPPAMLGVRMAIDRMTVLQVCCDLGNDLIKFVQGEYSVPGAFISAPWQFQFIAGATTHTPEPASFVLVGGALVLIGWIVRKKKH